MTTPNPNTPFALGARIRPHDPAEDRFRLTAFLDAAGVDLSQPRSLGGLNGGADYRPPIGDQGQLGSCASWSAVLAAQCARNVLGDTTVALHGGWLYEQVRKQEGTYPQDAGSYLADNCDLAMVGVPPLSEGPYVQDAGYDYPAGWAADEDRYLLSHHPFYPTEPDFAQQLCAALDAGLPVQIGMAWPSEWFNPRGGVVAGGSQQSIAGGHAVWVWGWEPRDGGYLLCANQWGTGWSADATAFRPDMRPGDFAIPLSLFVTFGWEARALTARPLEPKPQPPPNPPPPSPDDWQSKADAAIEPLIQSLASALSRSPRSTKARYELIGAQMALAAVKQATA